jgi:ABC-type sugar transport system ATPase subunit
LDEITRIADRVTIMRDGRVVETLERGGFDEAELVRLMVGREIENLYPKAEAEIGDVVLKAEGITRPGVLDDCSFEVRAGEILGFAGLIGAGRTELARAVFAADSISAGSVELDGTTLDLRSPRDAIDAGIGYLTEDRKGDGLALQLAIDVNITLARIPSRGPVIDRRAEQRAAGRRVEELDIRTPSLRRRVEALSGGTQQKVVLARWLETDARVLFFDEPARGIDVGTKAAMFELMGNLAADGRAIVLISSYLPELIEMCDRILVLRDGRIVGELERSDFSEERIIALASGVEAREAA